MSGPIGGIMLQNVTEGIMNEKIEFYTVDEVAKVLRLHPYTVRRLCREKRVPAFKFGGQWRFNKQEVDILVRSKLPIERN